MTPRSLPEVSAGDGVEDEDAIDEYEVDDDDLDADEDEDEAPTPSRGSVRSATWRRSRVPYLLRDVMEARQEVAQAERKLQRQVKAARAHGATWEELGLALSMSRQGAAKRYG